jgi:hypothetical protein
MQLRSNVSYSNLYRTLYASNSQPGFHELVLGVLPIVRILRKVNGSPATNIVIAESVCHKEKYITTYVDITHKNAAKVNLMAEAS